MPTTLQTACSATFAALDRSTGGCNDKGGWTRAIVYDADSIDLFATTALYNQTTNTLGGIVTTGGATGIIFEPTAENTTWTYERGDDGNYTFTLDAYYEGISCLDSVNSRTMPNTCGLVIVTENSNCTNTIHGLYWNGSSVVKGSKFKFYPKTMTIGTLGTASSTTYSSEGTTPVLPMCLDGGVTIP